ncbi:hypothetical protein [Pseudomonas syringae]|nr:hypothetical protein [Pseudomonas syringae]
MLLILAAGRRSEPGDASFVRESCLSRLAIDLIGMVARFAL